MNDMGKALMEYEIKMQAIRLIASTLNPIPLRCLSEELGLMAEWLEADDEEHSDAV